MTWWLREHAWDGLLAIAEIIDGIGCLITLTLYRPSIAFDLRLRRIISYARRWEEAC